LSTKWTDLTVFAELMQRYWEIAVHDGMIAPTTTPEDFYGFKITDIECVHQRLAGVGAGIWFRLRDGRVFDMFARESTPTRALYDVTMN
jgi:hypothetical protein